MNVTEGVDTYTVLADVGVERGVGLPEFVKRFQKLFDPEGGMVGFWKFLDTAPGSVLVKIERDMDEDREYAEARSDDPAKGLKEQIKAEYEEANKNTGNFFRFFNIVTGPTYNDTLEK